MNAFQQSSLSEIRYLTGLNKTANFFINGNYIVTTDEKRITIQDVSLGGDFSAGAMLPGAKPVTKEGLEKVMNAITLVHVDGKDAVMIRTVATTTLEQLRIKFNLSQSEFFFASGCPVYQINEKFAKVSEIVTTVQNGTTVTSSVDVRTAPSITLVLDGQARQTYAFMASSLKELRALAQLGNQVEFLYEDLPIAPSGEESILVREVIISGTVFASSGASSPAVATKPWPAPPKPWGAAAVAAEQAAKAKAEAAAKAAKE